MDRSLIINIRIKDVNDHTPEFPEKEFNISVKEDHAAGVHGGTRGSLSSLCHDGLPASVVTGCLSPSCLQGGLSLFTSQRSQAQDESKMP